MKKGEWCEIYKGNEAVRCLALQEASVSLPFFLSVDHDMSEFLVALESAVVQSECEFDVKWLIHCFAARFACSSHVFLNSFVKRCLNWFDEPPAKLLLNFLFENNELPQMDDPVALYFCNAMFKFAHRHPVLLRCMPEIERLVQAIGNERLLKFLGIYAFAFYFDSEGIREHLAIQDLNTEEVQMILMSNCRLCVWEAVQDAHFRVYQYPNDFPDAFSPALCSLTSSSIVKKKHFFDVVAGAVKKCLIDVNLDAIPMFVRTCPVVVPYLIIAYQSIVYCDPLKYTRLINASIPDLALNDIMEGFRNDIKLVKALYPEGDLEIPLEYVESHSIPFLFIEKLGDHSVIELTQKKYYIYDELETSRDRDFILGLHVLVGFLDLIKMEKLTSRAVKEIGTRAKECLSAIEDPAVLNHLCIDLFSIIFLRNVQGRFVCHASIARRIIKLVNMFNPTVYVKRAISCLFSQEIRKVSCDLKDYGTSILCDFLDKLEHRNFDIAGTYTSLEPQFRKIYIITRSMNELELKGASLAECALYKHELNVECGMTGLHPSDCLRYAMDTASDELVKLAIGNRLNSDPDRWLNPVGSKEWESSGPIAQNLDLFPTDFLATRQFRRFKPVLSKSLLDFVQYLDMYYRCRLLYFHVERKRPLNVLSFDVLSALQGPFNTGDYQKAQEVAECFGVDLFPYVLEHPQKFRIKKKTLKHFRNRYPLECWTLLLDEKKVNFLDPTGLTGILKKYWRTTKKYRSLQSRLHKSNSWSDLLEALNTTEIAPQNSITELPKLDEPISVEEAFPKKSFSTLHLHDQDSKDGNGKQWLFQPEDVAPSSTKTEKKVVIAGAELGKPQPFIHRRRQSVGWGENIKRIPMKPCRIESDSRCDLHRHFQMQIPIEKNPAVVLRPNSTGDLSKIDMQNVELQLEKGFLEMLQNPETDPRDLDDYVYRINPTRCCNITIQRNQRSEEVRNEETKIIFSNNCYSPLIFPTSTNNEMISIIINVFISIPKCRFEHCIFIYCVFILLQSFQFLVTVIKTSPISVSIITPFFIAVIIIIYTILKFLTNFLFIFINIIT